MIIKLLIFVFLFLILFQFLEQGPSLVENFAKKVTKKAAKKANDDGNSIAKLKQQSKQLANNVDERQKSMANNFARELNKLEMNIKDNYVSKNEFNKFKDEIQSQTQEISIDNIDDMDI